MGKPVLDPEAVVRTLHRASAQGASREQLLQLAATEVHAFGEPYTGVYLYMLHGDSLELEAFAGRATEHTRIAVGTGICCRAVSEDRDLNVPDVTRAEGYLACSAETKSELVVLLRRDGAVLGQIDIDSDIPDGFPAAEEAAVRQVADALAALL